MRNRSVPAWIRESSEPVEFLDSLGRPRRYVDGESVPIPKEELPALRRSLQKKAAKGPPVKPAGVEEDEENRPAKRGKTEAKIEAWVQSDKGRRILKGLKIAGVFGIAAVAGILSTRSKRDSSSDEPPDLKNPPPLDEKSIRKSTAIPDLRSPEAVGTVMEVSGNLSKVEKVSTLEAAKAIAAVTGDNSEDNADAVLIEGKVAAAGVRERVEPTEQQKTALDEAFSAAKMLYPDLNEAVFRYRFIKEFTGSPVSLQDFTDKKIMFPMSQAKDAVNRMGFVIDAKANPVLKDGKLTWGDRGFRDITFSKDSSPDQILRGMMIAAGSIRDDLSEDDSAFRDYRFARRFGVRGERMGDIQPPEANGIIPGTSHRLNLVDINAGISEPLVRMLRYGPKAVAADPESSANALMALKKPSRMEPYDAAHKKMWQDSANDRYFPDYRGEGDLYKLIDTTATLDGGPVDRRLPTMNPDEKPEKTKIEFGPSTDGPDIAFPRVSARKSSR